jgi:hypothetical protein
MSLPIPLRLLLGAQPELVTPASQARPQRHLVPALKLRKVLCHGRVLTRQRVSTQVLLMLEFVFQRSDARKKYLDRGRRGEAGLAGGNGPA